VVVTKTGYLSDMHLSTTAALSVLVKMVEVREEERGSAGEVVGRPRQ
jgi:hypothetical protein